MKSNWKKKFNRFVLFFVPKNRAGDFFVAFVNFVRYHKRLPTGDGLNDYLFKIRVSNEIMRVNRQFTSDKEYVKTYIKAIVGDEYNVPTKAVLKTPDEIDGFSFSMGDVVKPTHASGFVLFVDDEKQVNRELIKSWLTLDFYDINRESNYRYLQPKIIVERALFGRTDVDDIKMFCVNGKVKLIQWDFDRRTNHTRKLYDRDWCDLGASLCYPLSDKEREKPEQLAEMIAVAEKLSKEFWLIRIDLYWDELTGRFFVGELTHCHGGSNERFSSKDAERRVSAILFNDERLPS